jgi:hypothetical protein
MTSAKEAVASPVVHVTDEDGGSLSEEDDESEKSDVERARHDNDRGQASTGKAKGVPSCPICMNEWTADGPYRVR